VGELIFGVVVDILIHVSVENLEGRGVEWAATPSWNLIVLDSSKFGYIEPTRSVSMISAAARKP